MSGGLGISDNAVLLLAANLASVPQLLGLRSLIAGYPDVLHFTAVLELLLKVLPETTSPEDYLPIVYRLYRHESEAVESSTSRIPTSFIDQVSSLSQQSLRRKLGVFDVSVCPAQPASAEADDKVLTQWFFERARRVEEATGMIDLARRLVLPDTTNLAQPPPFPPMAVTIWGKGIVQVLETFIFNNDDEDELQLHSFEHLDPNSAVRLLLSRTTAEAVSRDVRNLVVPFVEYIQFKFQDAGKRDGVWETVWDWLLDRAIDAEMDFISNLANDWNEEDDKLLLREFLRTCLTACYLCPQSSPSIRTGFHRIHASVSRLSQRLDIPSSDQQIVLGHPETDLLAQQLRSSSPLTELTSSSLLFLDHMITSADIVSSLELPLRELVIVRAGTEQTQAQLVDQLLRSEHNWTKRTEQQWGHLQDSLNWLQSQSLVLGKLSAETLNTMVLTALLDATAFGFARDMFVVPQLLPVPILEKIILEAFYRFYDNATNGNRTRGGMKNAFQTLHVLDDPNSGHGSTVHAVRLVSATHALSSYSLSVTPSGTPITPAQLRMNKDPAFLVCKVIENNPPVHRNADRMIKILDDLIDGTQLLPPDMPQRQTEIDRMHARVYAAIVVAALADKDFTTAYNTCVNNLTPLTHRDDDTISRHAWEAFYKAGSYTSSSSRPGTSTQYDYQKMELLARAILICPKEAIEDCLTRWAALETRLLHPELVPVDSARMSGEHSRGFLATAADVGRSVARTASPIIGGRNRSLELERQEGEGGLCGWGSSSSRFGVRDSVKSGLTQGIGWLLGAPTQPNENREQQ